MVTPTDIWGGLSPEQYDSLRADIDANGIEAPILLMADGETIIDGHHRWIIAQELGIDCPSIVRPDVTTVDQAVAVAVERNDRRRTPRAERLGETIAALRRVTNWSNRRIAEELGVSEPTIRRHCSTASGDAVERTTGRDGIRRPSRRPTPSEVVRRRAVACSLAIDGYYRDAISRAMGISNSTLRIDLAAGGVTIAGRRRDEIPPERAYWRDGEPKPKIPKPHKRQLLPEPDIPPDIPGYVSTRVLDLLSRFHADFVDGDYANQFAWLVDEAVADGERGRDWLDDARELLNHVRDEVARFGMIVDDEHYRYRCRATEEGRESLRRPLRAVK